MEARDFHVALSKVKGHATLNDVAKGAASSRTSTGTTRQMLWRLQQPSIMPCHLMLFREYCIAAVLPTKCSACRLRFYLPQCDLLHAFPRTTVPLPIMILIACIVGLLLLRRVTAGIVLCGHFRLAMPLGACQLGLKFRSDDHCHCAVLQLTAKMN